jgi:predicted  nucleic acid-binding Zn-ribbon protein
MTKMASPVPSSFGSGAARDLRLLGQLSAAFASRSLRELESYAAALAPELSPEAAKIVAVLVRRRIFPFVATLIDGVCGQCNVAVPTGVASSVLAEKEVHVCLRCKRILVARGSSTERAVR